MNAGYVFQHDDTSFVDWESAAETIDEVLDYVREWKDGAEGSVVRFTAELEPVACVVWPEEEEIVEAGQLF